MHPPARDVKGETACTVDTPRRGVDHRAMTPSDRPWLFLMVGLPGAGKSTLARHLAAWLGARGVHLESDRIRKELAGWDPGKPLPREMYTPELNRKTFAVMEHRAREALQSGRSVVADATFLRAAYREPYRTLAREMEAGFLALYVSVDDETARRRLEHPHRDGFSDATVAVYEAMKASAELPPVDVPFLHLDGSRPPEENLSLLLEALKFLPIPVR